MEEKEIGISISSVPSMGIASHIGIGKTALLEEAIMKAVNNKVDVRKQVKKKLRHLLSNKNYNLHSKSSQQKDFPIFPNCIQEMYLNQFSNFQLIHKKYLSHFELHT